MSNFAVTLSEFAGIARMQLFGVPLQVSVPVSARCDVDAVHERLVSQNREGAPCAELRLPDQGQVGFLAKPDWLAALHATAVPSSSDPRYVSLLVANIGTTISPYMIFMVSSNVVEKNLDASDIPGQRVDNISGAIAAEIVTWFIIPHHRNGAVSRGHQNRHRRGRREGACAARAVS